MKAKVWVVLIFSMLFNQLIYAQFNVDSINIINADQINTSDEVSDLTEDDLKNNKEELLNNLSIKKQDLNHVCVDDMKNIGLFTSLQIKAFMNYRQLLGDLFEIHELQSIPYWDHLLIRKIQDYFYVNTNEVNISGLLKDFKTIDHELSFGFSKIIQRAKGYLFDSAKNSTPYLGSPWQYFVRLKGTSKNYFKYSILAEKDAGEKFWNPQSPQINGFFSAHLAYYGVGILKMLAIGDYTVNAGMGLIQWQSYAGNKTMIVADIIRKSSFVKPYSGLGEFNFHRGVAIVMQKKGWAFWSWLSLKKIDASLSEDSTIQKTTVNYVITSGYRRTQLEMLNSRKIKEIQAGCRIEYKLKEFRLGFNFINYHFSAPFKKIDDLEHLNKFNKAYLSNMSLDYQYRRKNHLFFGESAISEKTIATVNGWLCILSPKFDIAFYHRFIPANFHTFYSNAVSVGYHPVNEVGFLVLSNYNPNGKNRFSVRLDKNSVLSPTVNDVSRTSKTDILLQWDCLPTKSAQLHVSVNHKTNPALPVNTENGLSKIQLTNSLMVKLGSTISLSNKIVFSLGTSILKNTNEDQGFMLFCSVSGKLLKNRLSFRAHTAFFNTDSYNSRLNVFDVEPNNVINYVSLFDRGVRYSINVSMSMFKTFKISLSCYESYYYNRLSTGSSYDEISGGKKSKITVGIHMKY